MATFVVTGDQKDRISNKMAEVMRQVFLQKEYGHDPELLIGHLQAATEGRFVLSKKGKETPVIKVVSPPTFKTTNTDLNWWLDKAEAFAKKHLRLKLGLRQQFTIPTELPWSSAIPIFDPGTHDNRGMIHLLKKLGHDPLEQKDVMRYSGAQKFGVPTLHLIENSIQPNADTMGLSPDQLRATGKQFLRLRGYGLAMALYRFAKAEYLDPQTWTWFPEDRILAESIVAKGGWDVINRQIEFDWEVPSYQKNPNLGARLAISVPLVVS